MSIKCDVLIVGAGPAGCAIAQIIAKEDVEVIVIDRKFEIASPLRGGEAVCKPFYDDLIKQLTFLKKVPKWKTKGTSLEAGDCKVISKEDKWEAYLLERRVFEKVLAEEAVKAGAHILLGSELTDVKLKKNEVQEATIRTIRGKNKIEPKVVVAADGFASFFRKLLKMNKPSIDWASAIECEMTNIDFENSDLLQVFFIESIPGGYSYIFPKTGKRGLSGVAMRPQFNGGESALQIFERLRYAYPSMSKQLKNAHPLEIRGGCIDVSGPLDEPVVGNIVIVGDAANQNFAYIGEGIIPGIFATLIAGDKVAESIKKSTLKPLLDYPKEYKRIPLWKELIQTWRIKENIDKIIQKPIDVKIKLALMAFLEMEVIDWSGKEIPDSLKCKSLKELIEFGKDLCKSKNLQVNIT